MSQFERSIARACESFELASRAEESDETSELEAVVGEIIMGVVFGVMIIGAITFTTWALGLARYTRAW